MSIELLPVDIIGDHPHTGRRGNITVVDGKVTVIKPMSFLPAMVRVEFENGESCFAEVKNTRPVRPDKSTTNTKRDER